VAAFEGDVVLGRDQARECAELTKSAVTKSLVHYAVPELLGVYRYGTLERVVLIESYDYAGEIKLISKLFDRQSVCDGR
jgi:hypothetical protein